MSTECSRFPVDPQRRLPPPTRLPRRPLPWAQLSRRMRNADLLRSMVHEQRFGPETEKALEQLQAVMGQRLKQSLDYEEAAATR
jgi:hypothetical protein